MLTPRMLRVCLLVCLLTAVSRADLIIPASDTGGPPGPGVADVQMSVDLSASGGVAVMTFTNISSGSEATAVFKEIVVDTYDDDVGAAVLWDPVVQSQPPDVSYSYGDSNGLPYFHDLTTDATALLELQADPAPPQEGIGPGEFLQVSFSTALPDGAGINDYLAFFNGGEDTSLHTIGFHAICGGALGENGPSGLHQQGDPGANTLTIRNFVDLNENGALDPGEPLLAGWDFLVEGSGFSGVFTSGPDADLVIGLQAGRGSTP